MHYGEIIVWLYAYLYAYVRLFVCLCLTVVCMCLTQLMCSHQETIALTSYISFEIDPVTPTTFVDIRMCYLHALYNRSSQNLEVVRLRGWQDKSVTMESCKRSVRLKSECVTAYAHFFFHQTTIPIVPRWLEECKALTVTLCLAWFSTSSSWRECARDSCLIFVKGIDFLCNYSHF